ncbi:hypothetical protein ET445_08925 [Agromyces protaetiae]|uniref:Four-carbon acid sugar kinase family protein n=1 Tax=Agromyces protaetiae TaxID=2509455 RepID=A0A4P6FB27_9MICO|nr:four-carbon acid sugar kinase family protein [Agromyces protaetiae]QAY73440.1 hypothetical protein ET445_08925 [Agromyces protaetiae]
MTETALDETALDETATTSTAARVRALRAARGRVLVVFDDDPTGSQSVHGVPIVTTWHGPELDWALAQSAGAVFVLTNTRSLQPDAAAARVREIAAAVEASAARVGVATDLLLRGDSTLRGHHPLEADVLDGIARAAGHPYDAVVIAPAYLEAGRVTRDDVHLVRRGDGETPVGETDYARDATFGFRSSNLRDWVEERTGGAVRAADVAAIPLVALRADDGAARVRDLVLGVAGGGTIVLNALTRADLDTAAEGILLTQAEGRRVLVRSGPSFVAALLGLEPRDPLAPAELGASPGRAGLVVVGSHVELTTRQLARLRERRPGLGQVELDVLELAIARETAEAEIRRATDELVAALGRGDAVVSTSRARRDGADPAASLAFAAAVSEALVRVVRDASAARRPGWVIAKGGITSSDIATDALGITRAEVLGQLFPGMVSVWAERGPEASGLPYVVFAGNVGDDDALADAVERLAGD